LYSIHMKFTPYIRIYTAGQVDPSWLGDHSIRATLLFSNNLDYNKTLFGKRVNIHLGDEERIHTDGSIKSIWVKNITKTAVEFSDLEKINAFLKVIYHSVMTIAEVEGWDTKSFEKAYKLSIADNGNLVWYSKPKSNRNRSLKGRIKFSLDKDGKVPVIAQFLDTNLNPQFEIPIIDTFLHFVDWERVFEKPIWLDNEKFGFRFMKSQLLIYADTQARRSMTTFAEKNSKREEIEGHLRMLTFRQFASNKEFVEWANK
jgi:hypothetical protein